MQKQTISVRIDVTKIKKDWMYKGEKGTYLDVMLFMRDGEDDYGNNGMAVQAVPKNIREAEKAVPNEQKTRGAILGNAKVMGGGIAENNPGVELPNYVGAGDDLPF
jgi:hypothetical protein